MSGLSVDKPLVFTKMEEKKVKIKLDYVIISIYVILLTVLSVIFKQMFIKVLPCYISLAVMFLQARANKFCFLFGALNSIIYAVGYYLEGVYASLAEALVLSFPIQLITFFTWKRNEEKAQSKTRNLTLKQALITAAAFVVVWIGMYFVFKALGDSSPILDNSIFVLGLVIYLYTLFGIVESRLLLILSCCISLTMWIVKTVSDVKSITYVLLSVYNLYMCIKGYFIWRKIANEKGGTETVPKDKQEK